ncbi:MAG TPA: hypothetical protein VFF50_04080 [Candidatus Deferrimicrobiaceae bacterium]|nr:hypothetical protein [Candidatus Deferrimicrobiaceae bacterium]
MKTLLRAHIERDVRRLDQHVQAFTRQLADFTQIEVLNRPGQFTFFRRLLNYDDWRIAGRPKSTQFLDYQVVNSNIEAERDHLRVGDHIVRVLTMKEAITETRPLVLNALLKIPANFCAVTEWLLRFLRLAHIRPTVLGFLGADRVLRHPYFPRYVSRTRRHRFDGAASPMTTVTSPFAKLLLEVRSPLSRRTATRPPRAS